MSIRIEVRGDNLIDLADEFIEETKPILLARMDGASETLLRHVQRNLTRRYGTHGPLLPGQVREASPAGEPPRYVTGDLYRSVKKVRSTVRGRVVRGGVQTDDPGAARMEFGSTSADGITVAPRPFLRPAEETADPEIGSHLEGGL